MKLLSKITLAFCLCYSLSVSALEPTRDLVPWPWGTECPFPWNGVEGEWTVESFSESYYDGHWLEFKLEDGPRSNSSQRLVVRQFDKRGRLYAEGRAVADTEERVVVASMQAASDKTRFRIHVRSYPDNKTLSCTERARQVMVVAFCPLRGRRCLQDSNYTLAREPKGGR